MSIAIIDSGLRFTNALTRRSKTTAIILHHVAGTGSVEMIHQEHLARGWAGIGYNFYIRLDGSVWLGRGWDKIGAHAGSESGYNSKSIGICFEGDYTKLASMPEAQFEAGIELIKMALAKYSTIKEIKGHGEVYATACPGPNFPLAKFKTVTASTSLTASGQAVNIIAGGQTISGQLINGSTWGPVAAVCKAKGLTYEWDSVKRVMAISGADTSTIPATTGATIAAGSQAIAGSIISNTTWGPIAAVCRALGITYSWDAAKMTMKF